MKNLSFAFLFFNFLVIETFGQQVQGNVTYNRKTDWISIMSRLPYMTSEEIDRNKLTWGNYERKGTNYNLTFKNQKSVFTYKKESNEGGWSWKKEKYIIIRDQKSKTCDDIIESIGKTYRVKDDIPKRKWKILNEIKEIEGYLCMKAETKDTIKNQTIHAWFTDKIPFYGGPEGYSGLPGLILEIIINDGDVYITATDVDLTTPIDKLPVPKKMKGKEITVMEFDAKIKKFIDQEIEGEKNPYWRVRY